MALAFHRIAYKPLSRCSIDELAVEQAARDRREQRTTGGVAFARKDSTPEKDATRREILLLLCTHLMPGPISVLSMPGVSWAFEYALLGQREHGWSKSLYARRTNLHCVDNDRFVYYSATTKMPGNKYRCVIKNHPRPGYAEREIGNSMVQRYTFANVDDLMAEGRDTYDVAWLDYTGPLTVKRLDLIAKFYRERIRSTLILTSLKARWNKDVDRAAARHGGYCEWAVHPFADSVGLHAIEYQDGASPMFQFACQKPIAKATGAAALKGSAEHERQQGRFYDQ